MTTIERQTATVWRVDGKGRGWRSKAAAYRHAAIKLVNEACDSGGCGGRRGNERDADGAPLYDECGYCSRKCEGRAQGSYHDRETDSTGPCDGDCGDDPSHSYRYRLVGRLARWLQWRDARAAKSARPGKEVYP